jgi:hypothetical protein
MGGKNDAVAGFYGDQGLERLAVEVGLVVGTMPARMPTGSAIFLEPEPRICLPRSPHRFFRVLVLVVDDLGGEVIFDHFIFDDAHARLFHGQFRQGDAGLALAARAA